LRRVLWSPRENPENKGDFKHMSALYRLFRGDAACQAPLFRKAGKSPPSRKMNYYLHKISLCSLLIFYSGKWPGGIRPGDFIEGEKTE
jgi:hypothetical protein